MISIPFMVFISHPKITKAYILYTELIVQIKSYSKLVSSLINTLALHFFLMKYIPRNEYPYFCEIRENGTTCSWGLSIFLNARFRSQFRKQCSPSRKILSDILFFRSDDAFPLLLHHILQVIMIINSCLQVDLYIELGSASHFGCVAIPARQKEHGAENHIVLFTRVCSSGVWIGMGYFPPSVRMGYIRWKIQISHFH